MAKKYETGGIVEGGTGGATPAAADAQQQSQALMASAMQQMMDAFLKRLEQPLQATVALGELNRKQGQMNRIVSDATASRYPTNQT